MTGGQTGNDPGCTSEQALPASWSQSPGRPSKLRPGPCLPVIYRGMGTLGIICSLLRLLAEVAFGELNSRHSWLSCSGPEQAPGHQGRPSSTRQSRLQVGHCRDKGALSALAAGYLRGGLWWIKLGHKFFAPSPLMGRIWVPTFLNSVTIGCDGRDVLGLQRLRLKEACNVHPLAIQLT